MSKPKTEIEKQRDRMGKLHNRLVKVIESSKLSMPENYMVVDNIGYSMLASMRRVTGQD